MLQPSAEDGPTNHDTDNNGQLFVLNESMERHLEQLLGAVADVNTESMRVTRSKGENLEWSREMNPDQVLQEDGVEEQ